MQTLDELVGKEAQYDLIKQDVQGAEIMIMQGAPEIFKRANYVINEVNIKKDPVHSKMPDEKEMDLYMQGLGFDQTEVIDEHNTTDQIDKIYWKNNA